METELKHLHKDIEEIKKNIDVIRSILSEEYDLSEDTKKQLEIAKKTPVTDYIDHEEVKKRLLQ